MECEQQHQFVAVCSVIMVGKATLHLQILVCPKILFLSKNTKIGTKIHTLWKI